MFLILLVAMVRAPERDEGLEDLYTITERSVLMIQLMNVSSLKKAVTLYNKQYDCSAYKKTKLFLISELNQKI